jgi:segregation and condensation protein A
MLMTTLRQVHCSLENYQGPLECLYQLVLKREIDIRDVLLQDVAQQFTALLLAPMEQTLDVGAEFIGTMAAMMLLKSRSLLPRQPLEEGEEEEAQPGAALLHLLVAYCQIKSLAKQLNDREALQFNHYPRGLLPVLETTTPTSSGIEQVSLDDLSGAFRKILSEAAHMKKGIIKDEEWKVSDKLIYLRHQLKDHAGISLIQLFPIERPRIELIVTFLALLELLKGGEACLTRCGTEGEILVCAIWEAETAHA